MASRKEYDMLFSLNAQLGSSYTGTFTKAQQQIIAMQDELDALARQQADISSYQKQQAAVESTQKKLETLQQQYGNIQKEIQETGEFSSSLENKLLAKQQQIDKTSTSLSVQEQKLKQMGDAMREAGVDTNKLEAASAGLKEKIDDLKVSQEEAAEKSKKFGDSATNAVTSLHQALASAGIVVALREIYKAFDDVAKSTMQFESAMSVINATTGATADEMGIMEMTIRKVALDTGLYVNDVAKSARDLMEVGGDVALAMAQLEKGTNLAMATGTDMGRTFDFLSAVMKTFKLEASATDRVTDSFAYTTVKTNLNLSQLAESYVNVGGSAVSAGIDINELNAMLVILSEAGLKGGSAGTGLAGVLRNLSTPTEKAAEELRNLNIELYDAYGTSRDMFTIMQELEDVLGSLTDEQRKRSQSVIFDNVSLKTWNMVSATGIETAIELSNEISGASNAFGGLGQAAGMASVATDNAETELKKMEAVAAELKLVIGEQLTPTLGEVYKVGANVIGGVAEFIQKNPALVKEITVFAGVLGGVVAVIATYTAATKLATLASAALSAAIPGVNVIMGVTLATAGLAAVITGLSSAQNEAEREARALSAASREQYHELRSLEQEYIAVSESMGETSYEAQMLKKQFDEATLAFEQNRMTSEEAAKAHKELMDAYQELSYVSTEITQGNDKQGKSTMALVDKLNELMSVEGKTASVKQQILGIVEMLNRAMPELALSYDEYGDSLNTTADALVNLAEAEIKRRKNQESYDQMLKHIEQREELAAQEKAAYEQMEASARAAEQAERDLAAARAANPRQIAADRGAREGAAVNYQAAQRDLERWKEAHNEATEAVQNNEAWIEYLSGSVANYNKELQVVSSAQEEVNRAQEEASRVAEEMTVYLDDVLDRMDQLVASYNAAYDAALKSVQGQYQLWDEAARVVATSSDTINKGLESQTSYWQDYNSNIAGLSDRTTDIEGLSEMIASFADGSKDSVNAVAGMVAASDNDLKKMVANWNALQEAQKLVATNLAELKTDFTDSMAVLQDELSATVSAMDLGSEAALAGRDTILGFITGAEGVLPEVERAFRRLSGYAISGLIGSYAGASSMGSYGKSNIIDGSHAEGLAYVPYDGYIAEMHRGEVIVPADEAQIVALAPQLLAAFSALSATNAMTAESSGATVIYEITLAPQYHTNGMSDPSQLDAVFSANNANLREMLIEILEDLEDDEDRSRY